MDQNATPITVPQGACLVAYDIPDSLNVANPSGIFRRFGVRVNLSCWVFPQGAVPTEHIERLQLCGASVHMIRFEREDQDKILDLARAELSKQAKKLIEYIEDRCVKAHKALADAPVDKHNPHYKKWRAVLSKGRRELLAAEQCAFGFGINRDVDEALTGLKNLLSFELSQALAWRDQPKTRRISLPVIDAPSLAGVA